MCAFFFVRRIHKRGAVQHNAELTCGGQWGISRLKLAKSSIRIVTSTTSDKEQVLQHPCRAS